MQFRLKRFRSSGFASGFRLSPLDPPSFDVIICASDIPVRAKLQQHIRYLRTLMIITIQRLGPLCRSFRGRMVTREMPNKERHPAMNLAAQNIVTTFDS